MKRIIRELWRRIRPVKKPKGTPDRRNPPISTEPYDPKTKKNTPAA